MCLMGQVAMCMHVVVVVAMCTYVVCIVIMCDGRGAHVHVYDGPDANVHVFDVHGGHEYFVVDMVNMNMCPMHLVAMCMCVVGHGAHVHVCG